VNTEAFQLAIVRDGIMSTVTIFLAGCQAVRRRRTVTVYVPALAQYDDCARSVCASVFMCCFTFTSAKINKRELC
jgi:ABC-type sulfate transport system permease component